MTSMLLDNHAGRGMDFQAEINAVNEGYELMNLATFYEVPTPGRHVHSKKGVIFIRQPSIVDYMGTWNGISVVIEAKSTVKQSWSLKNLPQHQLDFLMKQHFHKAIAGVLLRYTSTGSIFWLPLPELLLYVERAKRGGRKSIHESEISETLRVKTTNRCRMDYLATIERLMKNEPD